MGNGPGLYFDFARLSVQVPNQGFGDGLAGLASGAKASIAAVAQKSDDNRNFMLFWQPMQAAREVYAWFPVGVNGSAARS
jgi:hypothetical protein